MKGKLFINIISAGIFYYYLSSLIVPYLEENTSSGFSYLVQSFGVAVVIIWLSFNIVFSLINIFDDRKTKKGESYER